jgi:RNA polymerase sigma-B factor
MLEHHVRVLPEPERTILRLRFVAGLRQSEIASEMAIGQMHVSRLLARSLTTLRPWCREIEEPL